MERIIYAGLNSFQLKEDATPATFNQALRECYGTDDQDQVNYLLFLIESTTVPMVMYSLPVNLSDINRKMEPAIVSGLKFLMACMTEHLTGDELYLLARKHLPKDEEFTQLLISNSKKKSNDLMYEQPMVGGDLNDHDPK